MPEPSRLLVMAPNWLGDAVMALPAIQDVRRRFPSAEMVAAARASVATLFTMVPAVDRAIALEWRGQLLRRRGLRQDVARLRGASADVALLLPNSFASAWLTRRAAIAERWGFATDLRRRLLSRAVRPPRGSVHQGRYYQDLVEQLDVPGGPLEPEVRVAPAQIEAARALLSANGWTADAPVVVLAPGAAYGTAKRWLPRHFGALIGSLRARHAACCVLVGAAADRETAAEVLGGLDDAARAGTIDLTGATSLEMLAALFALARVCVSNDSGSMHLAAAVGAPVVALFGPTREYETAPLTAAGGRARVLLHDVWCRPCMLRECPIDHRCMTGLTPERVAGDVELLMTRPVA